MNAITGPLPNGESQRAEDELPALYASQGLRVPIPVMTAALFIAWLAAERAPRWLLIGWVSAVAMVLLLRWVFNQIAARAQHIPIMYRLNSLAVVSALTGIVHGQSVLFWPYMDESSRVVQTMFVLGLSAGSVATQFGYMRIVMAYLLPALTPMALVWAQALAPPGASWLKGPSGIMLLLVAMYGGLLAVLARDTFKLFRESFESRQRLKRALEVAEAANSSKTRFLASASHDLRQPMHTLSLFSAALAMRPLDPVTRDITVQMNMAMHALGTQLDALLDISKLDAGVVTVNARHFPLVPFLSRLGEEFQPIAQRKGLELRVHLPSQGIFHTDSLLLERVLRNLLDNAIKYTDTGHVELTVAHHDSHFELRVRDTGQGIPKAEQERVFEEFYQLGNPQRDRTQGLGLGLSIVRRLASLLQIPIAMHSVPGQGTSFTLQLAAGVSPDAPLQPDVSTLPSIRGLRVLVIDDEEAVREGMRAVLEALGCEVQLAAGSEEAEKLARHTPPDVVLADFRLHGSDDGLAAVRRLRVIHPGLAALLVSGDTAPQRLREAHAAGLRLLHKPASVDALTRAIREEIDLEREKAHAS
jgi:signal transduction histidine kinase/CheY-like chemotaxis protein